MKKILAALLLTAVLCGMLTGCEKYPPIRQTDRESKGVYTFGEDRATYDLYRFIYMSSRKKAESEDPKAVPKTAEEKAAAHARDQAAALEDCARIYGLFALCRENGIDPYSKQINEKVKKAFEKSMANYKDYEEYQKQMADACCNDATYRLYLRYDVLEEELSRKLSNEGKLGPADDAALTDFVYSDQVACVLWVYRAYGGGFSETENLSLMNSALAAATGASEAEFVRIAMQYSTPAALSEEEARHYIYIGAHQVARDREDLGEVIFSLKKGELSSIVESADGYYLVRAMGKDAAYVESAEAKARWQDLYAQNAFYMLLDAAAEAAALKGTLTEFGASLNYDSMQ